MTTSENVRTVCDCCNQSYSPNELQELTNGEHVCLYCLADTFTTCECCGEDCYADELTCVENGDYVCEYCLNTEYARCLACGERHLIHQMNEVASGDFVCNSCLEDYMEDNDLLGNYHHGSCRDEVMTPSPDLDVECDGASVGIELELNSATLGETLSYTLELDKLGILNKSVICEKDVTTHNGCETIFKPYFVREFDEFMRVVTAVCKTAQKHGLTNGDNVGMHVHISRYALNEATPLYAIMRLQEFFYNFEKNNLNPVQLHGRDFGEYRRNKHSMAEHCSYVIQAMDALRISSLPSSVRGEIRRFLIREHGISSIHHSHGIAVNLEHSDTIEFRVFASTTEPLEILTRVIYTLGVLDYANSNSNLFASEPPSVENLYQRGIAYCACFGFDIFDFLTNYEL